MPRQLSPKEIRDWVQAYEEEGLSYADVARKFGRDIRTIKKGIAESWRGREAQSARAHLVQTALRKHHDSLLDVFDQILHALVVPPPTLVIPWQNSPEHVRLQIAHACVDCHMDHPPKVSVKINVEDDPLWELAHEHLRRDTVWDALTKWKQALASHMEARIALKRWVSLLMSEKTALKFWKRSARIPFLRPEGVDPLYQVILYRAIGVLDGTDVEGGIMSDIDRGMVYFGPTVMAEVKGNEESTRSAILEAFNEVQETEETSHVTQTHKSLEESTAKARRVVQEIALLGLVPGQCRVCRRLGV